MDIMEFISLLRQRPEADDVPVVAMSVFPHLKSKCLEGGCNDFLQKPIKMVGKARDFLPFPEGDY